MKNVLYLIILLLLLFLTKNLLIDIDSNTVEMILKNDQLIYVNNEERSIKTSDLTNDNADSITNSEVVNKKYLINLDDKKFIIFGFAGNNSFIFNLYDDINVNRQPTKVGVFNLIFANPINYVIKMVTEDIYIFSYINNNKCIIFQLNLNGSHEGRIKQITEISNLVINMLECDSFDGRNIFCVYSLAKYNIYNEVENIDCFYSFNDISDSYLNKNEIKTNSDKPVAASLSKFIVNNEKKFIICFVKSKDNNDQQNTIIYCQIFIQKDNEIFIDNLYKIGEDNSIYMTQLNFGNNNPISIKIFKNSIYLFLDITKNRDDKTSLLYLCSMDFGLIIKEKISEDSYNGDQNILVNDKYRILYKRKSTGKTELEYNTFTIFCNENIFQFSQRNQDSGIDIYEKIFYGQNLSGSTYYISFSVDLLTYLFVNNERNMGSNEIRIREIQNIELKYNRNLLLSYNYYIFYTKTIGGNIISSSNFCLFKVMNCYETCSDCNPNIQGTNENHQCSTCKTNYYRYDNNQNQKGYYNCYKTDDPKVSEGVYFDNRDQFYYKCDISCKTCKDNITCIICNNGYYFTEESKIGDHLNDKCYSSIPNHNYYLNSTANILYNGQIVNFVYKKCYDTCYSCLGDGDSTYNKCLKCIDGYIHYPFDNTKCTKNKDDCSFWEIDDNKNIECVSNCNNYIIYEGENKNQCVSNCQSYFNPYEIKQSEPLLAYSCDSYKYCITLETCKTKKLNNDNIQCFPPLEGCVNLDTYFPEENSDESIYNDPSKINTRVKLIKYFEFENFAYSDVSKDFILNQTNRYTNELNKELESHKGEYLKGIDFITLSKYKDFTITFYPLNAEEYVFNNLFEINNLCFVNFTQLFQTINYQISNDNYIILVALIEHINENLPINSINYFIILYDEENNVPLTRIDINNNSSSLFLETSYLIYNFNNSEIDYKYSTNLIDTIKDLYYIDQDLVFYDKNNKLFNDICYVYTSKEKTDMAIEDRIKEFYYEINLCENNCSLLKIYDKEKNPRSLCQCQIKENLNIEDENYSFDVKNSYENSKANVNALKCAKEVFGKNKIVSNSLFWIFIILLFVEVLVIINILFCGKSVIENMLKIKISNKSLNKSSKLQIIDEDNFNNNKFKSVKISENLKNSIYTNINDYKRNVYLTSPKKELDEPPRRMRYNNYKMKNNSEITELKANSNKDTCIYESEQINFNFENDVSLEDVYDGDNSKAKNNNYLMKEKNFVENNYLVFKRKRILEQIQNNLKPLEEKDCNKYNNIKTYYNCNDSKNENTYTRNLFLSAIDKNDKIESNSQNNRKLKNVNKGPNFKDISRINNNFIKKISQYSEIHGDSDFSGTNKFLQSENNNNTNNYVDQKKHDKSSYNENIKNNETKQELTKEKDEQDINSNIENNISDKNININKISEDIFIKNYNGNNDINSNNNNSRIENDKINNNDEKDSNSDIISNNYINRKQMSFDFKFNIKKKKLSDLISEENYLNTVQKTRNTHNNINSENDDLLKNKIQHKNINKVSKKEQNDKTKKLIKNSLNMSFNSNNKFINSKNVPNKLSESTEKKSQEKKSEIEQVVYNQKDILSSGTNEVNETLELNHEKNCFYFYLDYFIQREIFLATFYNKYDNIAYFIRISTLFLVISFIFMVNCLLLTSSDIHKRYLYAIENKGINEVKYIFIHEFSKILICCLIGNIIKILCIKFIYGNILFRLPSNVKEEMSPFIQRNINEKEYEEISKKRRNYIKQYWKKSIIFVIIVIALFLVFGYISICYIGTFPNTFAGIIIRYFISIIFSFIICAFICFIIVMIHQIGLLSCFNFIKKIY